MMMICRRMLLMLLTAASLTRSLCAATVWEFNGTTTPAGTALKLLKGTPAFVPTDEGQGLAPETALEWADAPELRLRPELEIFCRFRLDERRDDIQILAMKDGEYILRADWHEAGRHLAFFVQTEGRWEPRLRGPVAEPGVWYDVHVVWTGQELTMDVNGEHFSRPRVGRIAPGTNPLQMGPIAGVIDRLEIRNPDLAREAILTGIHDGAETPVVYREQVNVKPLVLSGENGWQGWQGLGGATCEVRSNTVTSTFPSPTAMLASPALDCDIAPLPFVCLELASIAPGANGRLYIVTDAGMGSIDFQPQPAGQLTVIPGSLADVWTGTLRRLALSFMGTEEPVVIRRLTLADRPVGPVSFYIRSLIPYRAKLRPGREKPVIMGLQNVGGEAEEITARLTVPKGVKIVGPAEHAFPYLGRDDFDMATWTILADRPGTYRARVEVSAKGAKTQTRDLDLVVEPWPDLAVTDYVPKPQPAKTDYISLMHYCALWKEGTCWNSWNSIEPWPEVRPAIGFYDEGAPEVADWHIKYALEHGINGFIYCWYRKQQKPELADKAGHAIYEGLFNAKYRDMFTFTIMWTNHGRVDVKDEADLLENLLPFWIEGYFKHPCYLKIDNKPIFFVYSPRKMITELGGPENTKRAIEMMRAQCREAGFDGLRVIACMSNANQKLGEDIVASGWDAVTGYNLRPKDVAIAGLDPAGLAYQDHADVLSRYKQTWIDRDACTGGVSDIPNVVMGWDNRPWGRVKRGINDYIAAPNAENFEAACRDARELIDAKPADRWDSRIVVFDNWTEFGEGHYIEPTSGTGFSFVNAIKRVFCTEWAPESITDIIPEDIGMPPPQRRYEAARAGYGSHMPWQPVRLTGDLLVRWEFENEEDGYFPDSSTNDCRLKAEGVSLEPGRGGRVLHCGDGSAMFPSSAIYGHPLPGPFFHPGGVTVALWCKPSDGNQGSRWLLNAVGRIRTRPAGYNGGYRLGLSNGRPTWHIPQGKENYGLTAPDPLPLGTWSHVAATFDNRVMRLYVNGKEIATREHSGSLAPGGSNIIVGAYSPTHEGYRFQGQLDSVRIYRRVLPAEEITDLVGEY